MPRTKHDRDLVAGKQHHEVDTVQKHYEISEADVKALIKEYGHSRERLYKIIEEKGYKKKEQEGSGEGDNGTV